LGKKSAVPGDGWSAALVVEVEFLLARDGRAIFGGRGEEPLLHGGDHFLVDRWFDAFQQGQLSDFAVLVNDGVEDDVAFGP
jgi:hypothetical protein